MSKTRPRTTKIHPQPAGPRTARVVGKDVEQGRIGKHDQPAERDEEAVECTVTQFVKIRDQRESDAWRDPGRRCEQTPFGTLTFRVRSHV